MGIFTQKIMLVPSQMLALNPTHLLQHFDWQEHGKIYATYTSCIYLIKKCMDLTVGRITSNMIMKVTLSLIINISVHFNYFLAN